MQRHVPPSASRRAHRRRRGWAQRAEAAGCLCHTNDDGSPFWDEGARYLITPELAVSLRVATAEVHGMCLAVAAEVAGSPELLAQYQLDPRLAAAAVASWEAREPDLLGRMDFMLDAAGTPRLLEYNAETPGSLVEAAVVALELPERQFNRLDRALVAAWEPLAGARVWFLGNLGDAEEQELLCYIAGTADRAGVSVQVADLDALEWRGGAAYDLAGERVLCAYKTLPFEHFDDQMLDALVGDAAPRWVEPPWRVLLSNKAVLPLLWRRFPGHPNLLPAYAAPPPRPGGWVTKPLSGWGGQGVCYHAAPPESLGPREVAQRYAGTAECDGVAFVVGSWTVRGRPAGFGFREDGGDTIVADSSVVPHALVGSHPDSEADSGTGSDTGSETASDTSYETASDDGSEAGSEPGSDADPQAGAHHASTHAVDSASTHASNGGTRGGDDRRQREEAAAEARRAAAGERKEREAATAEARRAAAEEKAAADREAAETRRAEAAAAAAEHKDAEAARAHELALEKKKSAHERAVERTAQEHERAEQRKQASHEKAQQEQDARERRKESAREVAERERLARDERAQHAAEQKEAARREREEEARREQEVRERKERERQERERKEQDRKERERQERERKERERKERERKEQERKEREREKQHTKEEEKKHKTAETHAKAEAVAKAKADKAEAVAKAKAAKADKIAKDKTAKTEAAAKVAAEKKKAALEMTEKQKQDARANRSNNKAAKKTAKTAKADKSRVANATTASKSAKSKKMSAPAGKSKGGSIKFPG